MSTIYILLTRSKTLLSRTIHTLTGDSFTHVSLAFDARLESLCSFSRIVSILPLPSGLMHERLDRGYFGGHPHIRCALYALEVPHDAFCAARLRVTQMLAVRSRYHYSVRGLFLCRMGIREERPHYYFCSQFVAHVLEESGALSLPKPPSLMRPQDFASLPGLFPCFCGELCELKQLVSSRPARCVHPL
ncbi:MAG TPA: hypothetical protein IAC49_00945 [Candidatus Ventricola intestinavium]|nr:hypothetical protein [Candidatus Ventricola intestinavium]